jgi:hypothetical protein
MYVDNIKMDLGDISWSGMDCIGLAQDRNLWRALVNPVMNLRDPYNAGRFKSSSATGDLSKRA